MVWGPFPQSFTASMGQRLATFTDPLEEERLGAIPPSFRVKGMFVLQMLEHLDAVEFERLRPSLLEPPLLGKYLPFSDYPTRDLARIEYAMVHKRYPDFPLREGLRRNGYQSLETFAASTVGRMLVSLAGNLNAALERFPSALAVTNPQGRILHQRVSANEVKLRAMDFPGWVDAGLVGTLEALCVRFGALPTIDVTMHSPASADYRIVW